jgi:hypothetical protein
MTRTVVVALTLFVAASAGAQNPDPRVIAGVVTDTAGIPLDSIDISIASLRRRTTSDANGRFRFTDVKPGTYDVSARHIGYGPQVRSVKVGDNGGVVTFSLVPMTHVLAPVISSISRGGISGVVGDTAFNVLVGATISVLASEHRAATDSTGSFFVDVRPGKHMLRVSAAGFGPRVVSVTVPNDSGRRIVVWLAPATREQIIVETVRVAELQERLTHRRATSVIYTREDIARMNVAEVTDLARIAANVPRCGAGVPCIDEGCFAIIDGGPQIAPLWDLQTADIETLEVYPPKSLDVENQTALAFLRNVPPPVAPRARRGSGGRGSTNQTSAMPGCGVLVFAWLRK